MSKKKKRKKKKYTSLENYVFRTDELYELRARLQEKENKSRHKKSKK